MKQKKVSKIISIIFISAFIVSFLNFCLYLSPNVSANNSEVASMDCGKLMDNSSGSQIANNSNAQNSVLPCCINNHETQKANLKVNNNYDPDIQPAVTINNSIGISSPEFSTNHFIAYSSSSPPREFLSSILKKE